VHVGAGRTTFSSGVGPVTVYKSAGGGRQRGATNPSRTSVAAYERQKRQAEKAQRAEELQAVFDTIEGLHREDFAVATPPVAPQAAPVDEAAVLHWHEQHAMRGLGVTQRSARAQARRMAAEAARQDTQRIAWDNQQQQQHLQQHLNDQWHRLLSNDPNVVGETLTEAFEDNEAPAAVTGVQGGEASVVVLVPGIDAVPERMPGVTAAGNLSLAKITKGQRNAFYLKLVCGYVLGTVREALAVAPGLHAVRVAVIRRSPSDAYGVRRIECLLGALFTRPQLQNVWWQSAESDRIVQDASAELSINLTAARELRPLDLTKEPGLAALIAAIDEDDAALSTPASRPVPVPATTQPVAPLQAAPFLSADQMPPTTLFPSTQPPATSPGQPPRRKRRRPTTIAAAAGAAVLLILVIAGIVGGTTKNAPAAAVATASPTLTASPTTSVSTHPAKSSIKARKVPRTTRKPVAAVTTSAAAPAHTEPAVTPSSAHSSPTASSVSHICTPKSNEGTCYRAGEYCRDADHGDTGWTADGEEIMCEDNDGWRWEAA
jgi:hypothetical protein